MNAILHYLNANKAWEIPVLLTILVNVTNGLTSHPQVQSWFHTLIDVLSFIAKKDAPGQSLKLPLASLSKRPDGIQQPDAPPVAPKVAAILLPFVFAASFFGATAILSGCPAGAGATVKTVGSKCLLPSIEKLVSQELPVVVASLASGDYGSLLQNIIAVLVSQGVADASDVISCAVKSVSDNAVPARVGQELPPALVVIHDHAVSYLQAHPAPVAP